MKHKIITTILIIIIVIATLGGLKMIDEMEQKSTKETGAEPEVMAEIPEVKEPVVWRGNYIWNGTTENNQWMCFRKTVDLTKEDIQKAVAQIAVDSKYWLYINGEMAVREGGLKRGETKNSIYYDEVEFSDYLKEGKNTIAILVWYWGDIGFSHHSSEQGALLFQAKMGNVELISDETWKVKKHEAYLQDKVRPNYRINEYNVWYNASLELDNWYKPDYDDSSWVNSTVLNVAGSEPWGELIERDIPQFKDFGLKEYENMEDYRDYVTTKEETLALKIPYNAQFSPYLKIEAEAGQEIEILTDFYQDINGDSVRCTYVTKAGVQEFESLAWMNGETVYYTIPAGVKILSLGYRETGYHSEMTGNFESNDEFFNQLWQMANRTLYVNMRDNYMDCPNRERAQWFGDISIEMLEAMYALDTQSYDLYEKAIKTTIGWKYDDILLTVVPMEKELYHLPFQMLIGIGSMYDYYEYTGKRDFLEYVYPHVKNYLNLWEVKEDGLVRNTVTGPIWSWGDSSENVDYEALENAWYYFALSKLYEMAKVLGYQQDVSDLETRLSDLKESFNHLWTEAGYQTSGSEYMDERANAVAVISGLAGEEKYDTICGILTTSYHSSTFIEKYILEALCKMGKIEEAQERIKYRYDEMVNGEESCSTLWEFWDAKAGTKNHAWAGGPLIIMSKYFAGIEPLEKGYETISIKPQFGKLTKILSNVTTIKGDVNLEAEKFEDSLNIKIRVPTKTRIAIQKMTDNPQISVGRKTIYKNGKPKKHKEIEYDSEDEQYIYFYVEKGEYEFRSK